ncbi:MAG: hypothetical protein ACP5QU_05730 [Anaerolineae bacterium]
MKPKDTSSREVPLDALEAHLAGMLKPVQPPKEVISRLQRRIRLPRREQVRARLQDWHALFLVLGGVISGMVVILTVGRALFHLVWRRNI